MVGGGEEREQGVDVGRVTYSPYALPMKLDSVKAETHTGTGTRADTLLSHWAVENLVSALHLRDMGPQTVMGKSKAIPGHSELCL